MVLDGMDSITLYSIPLIFLKPNNEMWINPTPFYYIPPLSINPNIAKGLKSVVGAYYSNTTQLFIQLVKKKLFIQAF